LAIYAKGCTGQPNFSVFMFHAFDTLFLSWFWHGLLLVLQKSHINDGGVLPKTLLLVGFRIDISYRQKNKVKTGTYKEYVESVEQKNATQLVLQAVFVSIFGSFHSSLRMLYRVMSVHSPRIKLRFRIMPSILKPTFSKTLCEVVFLT